MLETLTSSFQNKYANAKWFFSLLSTQSCLFSSCKGFFTFKGLVGSAPSSSIVDKKIVQCGGFSKKKLWRKGDLVITDKAF